MRRVLTFSLMVLSLTSATGCTSCWDRLCRFEAAKNEALFGWMRGPQPQPQTVCYDPCATAAPVMMEPTCGAPQYSTSYGAPTGSCCQDGAISTMPMPTPAQ